MPPNGGAAMQGVENVPSPLSPKALRFPYPGNTMSRGSLLLKLAVAQSAFMGKTKTNIPSASLESLSAKSSERMCSVFYVGETHEAESKWPFLTFGVSLTS